MTTLPLTYEQARERAEASFGPTPNLALLDKVLAHIDDHPDEWDQSLWYNQTTTCGTQACVAGWAVMFDGGRLLEDFGSVYVQAREDDPDESEQLRPGADLVYVSYRARRILGLAQDEAVNLFYGRNNRRDIETMASRIRERAALIEAEVEALLTA